MKKKILALILVLTMMAGMQALAFAQVDTSAEAEAVDDTATPGETTEAPDDTPADTSAETTAGATEDNPDTGAAALPLVAAVLAAAAVPVMIKTRKK